MWSEIERVRARREGRHFALHPRSDSPTGSDADALAPLLEMNGALSAARRLDESLRGALEVLARDPAVTRGAVSLSLSEATEIVVESDDHSTGLAHRGEEHGFACTTIAIGDRPVGALAVELFGEAEDERDRVEFLLHAAAELIAQAVNLRLLLGSPPETGDGGDTSEVAMDEVEDLLPAEGAAPPVESLAEMVSSYEKGLIESALRTTRGNRARAAKLLRTTERIVGYRVKQYGIDCRVFRD